MHTRRILILVAILAIAFGTLAIRGQAAGSAAPGQDLREGGPQPQATPTVVTLHFDSEADGTRISDDYSAQGVYFLNDYYADAIYRSSPQIKAVASARSSPNVLTNDSYDAEIFNSGNVPMVIWFDQPMAGVGMYLGTTNRIAQTCSGVYPATVKTYDCNGNLVAQGAISVTSAFTAPLEVDDALGSIRKVVIDYGSTGCPEAIDDFAFTAGAAACTDSTAPVVAITSHSQSQVVNTATQWIAGTVQEAGILTSVKINGSPVGFYLKGGLYYFSGKVSLHEGSNTITVLAKDAAGNKGSAQVVLILGVPSSVSLSQFHLTQRGVMQNTSCDVDGPMVAGKSAVVRLALSVKTSGGADTYVSSVELKLYRKGTGGDTLVDTVWGTTYSPYLSQFNTASQMTGIHFFLDGDEFATAGDYKFSFQAYAGLTAVGQPLIANCSGQYFTFSQTDPIKLLILPVEAGVYSPDLANTTYYANKMKQIATLDRTMPVADYGGASSGVVDIEQNPWPACDGTSATAQADPTYCGVGWAYKFLTTNASGILTRADAQTVYSPTAQMCGANDHNVGGRIASSATYTMSFIPNLGVFRLGAHPGWQGAKHTNPVDEDFDGDIDLSDMAYYVGSFFDLQTSKWITDINQYDTGETFRFFYDQNGNNCNDTDSDPQSPVRQKFDYEAKVLFGPQGDALTAYNNAHAGTSNDADVGSLWFPLDLTAYEHTPFGGFGPGQGNAPGNQSWIIVVNDSTLAHETGHNIGGLDDLYYDSIPDDMKSMENAWAVYVNGEVYSPTKITAVMSFAAAPDSVVHAKADYQTLFDKLKVASSSSENVDAVAPTQQFFANGFINKKSSAVEARTGVGSGLATSPLDPGSPYALAFGSGSAILLEYPFKVEEEPLPPEGMDSWPLPFIPFQVVAPLPDGTAWVDLRRGGETLRRFTRSQHAPTVQVLAPNGGESYGANDQVTVRWSSQDADGDPLLHTVYYSPDGGENWLVAGAVVSGTQFLWNLAGVPGTHGNLGLLKVEASDGFNSAADQSNGFFTIAGKPPQASIVAPNPGQSFMQCEKIQLQGAATDPEGQLARIIWAVDGSGADSSLRQVIGPLAPGAHTLRLLVMDGQGLQASSQVTVTVIGDADCDGMSDAFEERYGLDSSLADDAAWDLDEDGLRNFEEAWYGTDPRNPDTDGDGWTDGDEVGMGSDPNTPQDTPTRVYVWPPQSTLNVSDTITVELRIDNIRDLYGAQVELDFDPNLLQVVDAYASAPGVQIWRGDFPAPDVTLINQVDNTTGRIQYAVSLQGSKPGVGGSGTLARIVFRGSHTGTSQVNFTRVVFSNPLSVPIPARAEGGVVIVQQQVGAVAGRVILERRTTNSGSNVCLGSQCTVTGNDGRFIISGLTPGVYTATVTHASYLRTQRTVTVPVGMISLPDVALLGGDIVQDGRIELADLNVVSQAWNSTPGSPNWDERADVTDDGIVNVLDAVAIQFNWDKTAPGPWPALPAFGSSSLAAHLNVTAQVYITPAAATLAKAGDAITLAVRVENVSHLYSARVKLSFNPQVLQVRDADPDAGSPGIQILPGDFLDPMNQLVLINTADNTTGVIDFATSQTYPATGKDGSGVLCWIVFEAKAVGNSPVHALEIRLLDDSRPDPVDIPATITEAQVTVGSRRPIYLPVILVNSTP